MYNNSFEEIFPNTGNSKSSLPFPLLLTCEHAATTLPKGYSWPTDDQRYVPYHQPLIIIIIIIIIIRIINESIQQQQTVQYNTILYSLTHIVFCCNAYSYIIYRLIETHWESDIGSLDFTRGNQIILFSYLSQYY